MTQKTENAEKPKRLKPAQWVVVAVVSLVVGLILFKVGYSIGAAIAETENARDAAPEALHVPSILSPIILA